MDDKTTTRTIDRLVADFTFAEFLQSVGAINALTETQFAVVNNDIVATISGIFADHQ